MSTARLAPLQAPEHTEDQIQEMLRDLYPETEEESTPGCECLPGGRARCWRTAVVSALLTSHGCERDGRFILMCQQCRDSFHGGGVCAPCDGYPIYILREIAL